ncbi:hypothetical protein Tco_1452186, partial [Tanacetum coccineum]
VFLTNQLKNVPVPLDHFPLNALTTKVFSFMVKKGKKNSGNVTPLFPSMLAQPTEDEDQSEPQPETQTTPSPTHPSEDQSEPQPDPFLRLSSSNPIPDSIPEALVGIIKVIIQAKQIQDLKAQIKKLKKKARPVITHHKAWMKSVSIKTRLTGKKSMQKKWMQKESYMETKDVHNEKGVSTEDQVSTVKPDEGTDKPKVSTDKISEGTNKPKVSIDKIDEGTAELKSRNSDETATPTVFRDDETIAEFLVSMSQNKAKKKGVEIKDAEDSNRPRPTSIRSLLTLKPLPKTNPKDKGKKVLEEEAESDAESEGVNEVERKFSQLANDEEIARKRRIKDVNKKSTGIKKDDSIKEESKEEESTRKRKLGTRKKMKSRKRRFRQDTSQDDQTDSEKGNDELRLCLTIATDEDKEVDYEILNKKYPIIE